MKRVLALLGAALAVTSCASAGRPGVRVDAIQADIVFGVKQAAPGEVAVPGAPPGAGQSTPPPPLRVPSGHGIAFQLPGDAVQSSCPQAPIGSAPEAPAADNATQPPAPGLYRYKVEGTETVTTNGAKVASDLHTFEPRVLRNVRRSSDTLWTYEVVAPNASGGSDVTTWSVNTKPVERTANPIVAKEVTVGEPARGVAISRIDSYDGNGNNTAAFGPTPPILQLPLPVVSGASFSGAGVDSKSGQTEQVNGTVQARQTVDACGTLVDGWLVHLDINQTDNGASVSRTEDDVFSTDLGGLLISRHIVQTYVSGTSTVDLDVTYSLGQTTPSAVPAGDS